jgi:hypothetical protein
MAISEAYTGTVTISTTEISLVSGTSTLQSIATPAVIQVFIDTVNMVSGDQYRVQIKDKIISGGTQRTIYDVYLESKQSTPFVTPTLILYHGWDVTMDLITGTGRSISWSIRKVA